MGTFAATPAPPDDRTVYNGTQLPALPTDVDSTDVLDLAQWKQLRALLVAVRDAVPDAGAAPIASPTFTGTVSGVTKAHVGLGSANDTSDASKPISTATQTALDAKAPIASPTFTGTVSGVTKAHVGLSNVDNTSDAGKPISTATQTALDAKASAAITIRTVTAAANILSTDEYLRVNSASPVTITMLTGMANPVVQIRQVGAAQVTLAGAGVTLSGFLKTSAQNTSITLIRTGTNAFDVEGGVA